MELITKEYLQEVREKWVANKEQLLDPNIVYYISIGDIKGYRKKKRTRRNSKAGSVDLEYNSIRGFRTFKRDNTAKFIHNGQEKWDKLVESMTNNGWVKEKPALLIIINRRSHPVLRDGHHRLGVAIELGMTSCPFVVKYVNK